MRTPEEPGMITCTDHSFPEEQTPSGRLLLGPCLTCGLNPGDAIGEMRFQLTKAREALDLNNAAMHGWMDQAELATSTALELAADLVNEVATEESFSGNSPAIPALTRAEQRIRQRSRG